MTYLIDIDDNVADKIAKAVLEQIKNNTIDKGVINSCNIVLNYIDPIPLKEFKDSGFTDDFGVSME
tara:strand:- start:286 stop:483 length:198 start_codon:yes stop_codon:yes gene_type:complete